MGIIVHKHMTHSLYCLPWCGGMCLLEGLAQHIRSLAHHLDVLYHGIVGKLVSDESFKGVTVDELRYIVGIFY